MAEMTEPEENNNEPTSAFDELLPGEMAAKAQSIGIKKANLDFLSTFALAVLAGAFIALGCIFFTISQTTGGVAIPWGVSRVIGGFCFSLGLIPPQQTRGLLDHLSHFPFSPLSLERGG